MARKRKGGRAASTLPAKVSGKPTPDGKSSHNLHNRSAPGGRAAKPKDGTEPVGYEHQMLGFARSLGLFVMIAGTGLKRRQLVYDRATGKHVCTRFADSGKFFSHRAGVRSGHCSDWKDTLRRFAPGDTPTGNEMIDTT